MRSDTPLIELKAVGTSILRVREKRSQKPIGAFIGWSEIGKKGYINPQEKTVKKA